MKKKFIAIIFVFVTIFNIFSIIFMSNIITVNAENKTSEIVMEVNSGRVLYSHNEKDKKYMASTTKILTAITIIENCNLSDIVTVTKETVGVEGSSIYLVEGEKLCVKDLLYGLMLRSGNDCAETLAVYCSGSIKEFAILMNETAKKIGANESNFVNPHGLHDENHYTTAYDLALISRYAMMNNDFREIVSTKVVNIPHTKREYGRHLVNKNKMLNEFEGSTGIKTGYTKKAGRCLVSSCVRDGMELICVVLNCAPMFERSKSLLSQCFNDYSNYKLVESDHIVGFIKINNCNKEYALYVKKDVILPLNNDEYNKIEIKYEYPESIDLIENNSNEVGYVKIYCENNLLFKEKIYTILEVE